jgi:hypothetical protein
MTSIRSSTSFSKRGRPSKDLAGYKDLIEQLYLEDNLTAKEIIKLLAEEYSFVISLRQLNRCIKEWNFRKQEQVEDTPQLRARISTCFYLLGLEDSEMLMMLKEEGNVTSIEIGGYTTH